MGPMVIVLLFSPCCPGTVLSHDCFQRLCWLAIISPSVLFPAGAFAPWLLSPFSLCSPGNHSDYSRGKFASTAHGSNHRGHSSQKDWTSLLRQIKSIIRDPQGVWPCHHIIPRPQIPPLFTSVPHCRTNAEGNPSFS